MSLPHLSAGTILGPAGPVFTSQCLLLWAEMMSFLLTPVLPLTDLAPASLFSWKLPWVLSLTGGALGPARREQ